MSIESIFMHTPHVYNDTLILPEFQPKDNSAHQQHPSIVCTAHVQNLYMQYERYGRNLCGDATILLPLAFL